MAPPEARDHEMKGTCTRLRAQTLFQVVGPPRWAPRTEILQIWGAPVQTLFHLMSSRVSTNATYHDTAMSRADHIVAADEGGGRALRRVAPAGRALVPSRQAEGLRLPTFGRGRAGADCEKGDGNKEWPPSWEVPHHLGGRTRRSRAATTAFLGVKHLTHVSAGSLLELGTSPSSFNGDELRSVRISSWSSAQICSDR